jgi:hypothetical protein
MGSLSEVYETIFVADVFIFGYLRPAPKHDKNNLPNHHSWRCMESFRYRQRTHVITHAPTPFSPPPQVGEGKFIKKCSSSLAYVGIYQLFGILEEIKNN